MEIVTPAYFTGWLWGTTHAMYEKTLYHKVLKSTSFINLLLFLFKIDSEKLKGLID